MTAFEKVLFITGLSVTVLASIGLCAQVYSWRFACGKAEMVEYPRISVVQIIPGCGGPARSAVLH